MLARCGGADGCWELPMSRLTALVPGAVCAAALGRAWPEDLDGQVRCIDEGTRSLGLAHCCAPWSPEAEDAALRAELGLEAKRVDERVRPIRARPSDALWESGQPVSAANKSGNDPAVTQRAGADFDGDAVAAALARMPGAPGVMGLVSGPLTWSLRAGSSAAPEDAVDAASDLACDRLRELAERGVERIAVLETWADGVEAERTGERIRPIRARPWPERPVSAANKSGNGPAATRPTPTNLRSLLEHDGADQMVEAHRPIVRSAAHLRVEVILVATHSAANAAAQLAYEHWVGPDHCSEGFAFLPATALASPQSATDCISRPTPADTVVTAPLSAGTDPDLVRLTARLIAELGREDRQ